MNETLPITFVNLFDKEVLSTSAFTLSFLFEKNTDACFLYLFYSYIAKTKEQPEDIPPGSIRADDIYCREKLSWGQVRFYRAKKFLESVGLIHTQTKKSEDGKFGGSFINLSSFRAPGVFVEIPNQSTPTSTVVQARRNTPTSTTVQARRNTPTSTTVAGNVAVIEPKNQSISSRSTETSTTVPIDIYRDITKTTGDGVPPIGEKLLTPVGNTEPTKCQPRTNPCGHCSRCGLFPCTDLEKWEIANSLKIPLPFVKEKHEIMWEMIEAGVFQKKYKNDKTLFLTLKNWLRMDVSRGRIQVLENEFDLMDLADAHPDKVKEWQEVKRRAKERGDV